MQQAVDGLTTDAAKSVAHRVRGQAAMEASATAHGCRRHGVAPCGAGVFVACTVSTGHGAQRTTFSATLPSSR